MPRILGLDLGPNSIGWALIDDKAHTIIDAGVRVFQEGVANLNQGDREESWNKQRRDARGARINNARYRQRRNQFKAILIQYGLMPEARDGQDRILRIDPYEVRLKGLDEKLSLHEFGRALYHLNQRRGFQSNRKVDTSEDSKIYKGSKGKIGITATEKAIQESGSRTLGEHLAGMNPHEERRRNRYTLRQMYVEEFEQLWKAQARHWPTVLTEELREAIRDIIFFQRPLKSQKHTIGYCTFEPSKRRAPVSSPTFQRYRILEQVNRLRLSDGVRYHEPLTPEERAELIVFLEERKDATFEQVKKRFKKQFNLPLDIHFNLEDQKKLKGNRTYSELAKVFGKKNLAEMPETERLEIWHTFHFADNPEWLETYAREKWGLDDEAVKKHGKVDLESGYARLSHKAMHHILPFLELGFDYDVAVVLGGIKKAFGKMWEQLSEEKTQFLLDHVPGMVRAHKEGGFMADLKEMLRSELGLDDTQLARLYHHSLIGKYPKGLSHLPEPDDLRNPLVQQAMYELRRVVNAIVREHGKPDVIRVELARDLKLPKKLRQQITKSIGATGEKAEKIRERLRDELNFANPSRESVQRYLLWEELGTDGVHTCPYTGKVICLSDVYSGDFEIEHILPYSRSLDDSMANKTLCWKPENQEKGERTPYEAYGHDDARYQEIRARVKKAIPHKLRKFTQKELDDDFVNRQLVDAAYFSKEARSYLQSICERVEAVSGRTTARLRKFWGLNRVLSGELDIKTRDDHRHHAVDALVIANTTPGFVHRLSLYNEYRREPNQEKFGDPWPAFRVEAQLAVNDILVSHRIKDQPRGKLHKETYYGKVILPDGREGFVYRKLLISLTDSEIRKIVDGGVRQAVAERLKEYGVTDITQNFTVPKEAFKDPLFLKGKVLSVRSVRIEKPSTQMVQLYPEQNLYVLPGKNHHIVIYEHISGSKQGKWDGEVVSLYEAAQRVRRKEPVIQRDLGPDKRFIMSLTINEMVKIETPQGAYWRVQVIDGLSENITFRLHNSADITDSTTRLFKNPNSLKAAGGMKAQVDPLGKVFPTDD